MCWKLYHARVLYHRAPPPSLLGDKLDIDNNIEIGNVEQDEPALDIEEVTELDVSHKGMIQPLPLNR